MGITKEKVNYLMENIEKILLELEDNIKLLFEQQKQYPKILKEKQIIQPGTKAFDFYCNQLNYKAEDISLMSVEVVENSPYETSVNFVIQLNTRMPQYINLTVSANPLDTPEEK